MEEYIRLEEEKARRHGRTSNWQTAKFRKVENYEDEDNCFIDFETEFPAIIFDNTTIQYKPTVCPPNENMIDFRISLDESDDEDYTVIFDEYSFLYKIIAANDLKTDLEDDHNNMPSLPNPTDDYFDDLDFFKDFKNEFPAIVYNDGLTSKSDLEIKPLINPQHIYEFNLNDETSLSEGNVLHLNDLFNIIHLDNSKPKKDNDDNDIDIIQYLEGNEITHDMAPLPAADQRHPWLRYQIEEYSEGLGIDLVVRLRMVYFREGQQLGGVKRRMKWRQFILALGLHTEQEMAEAGDFLGPAPSYILIQDPMRRLCHRMIGYSISGRGRHLRSHAKGRKSRARMSGRHFIWCLAMHFELVSDQGLRGLQLVTRELLLIDLHELGRLHICTRYGDTWAWVAQGPERQQAAVAGAYEANEAGPPAKEVSKEIPSPAQAPLPPLQPRTMSQRI
uniref:Uncharacterized protein n=1 Tax=Tanacetum cinerariifolium TaxID=118510 RepID=A0A6L2KG67_TANCI|nr:hypothetical protein [Tanacetum cinerariifolium]